MSNLRRFKEKHEHVCHYCEKYIKNKSEVTVDHKTATSQGGTNNKKNLVIACAPCNTEKSSMNEKQFLRYLCYKEKLRTLSIEQLNQKRLMFKSTLREEGIKNGKNTSYFTLNVSRRLKAVNYVLREKGGQ